MCIRDRGSTSDTIWLDGRRLLGMIREHMLGRPGRLARLPLLLNELRRGDKQRAAQTLVGYDTTSTLGAQQIVIHLVNCYDVYGPVFRRMRDSVYATANKAVSYTHLRAHETPEHLVCRLLL